MFKIYISIFLLIFFNLSADIIEKVEVKEAKAKVTKTKEAKAVETKTEETK